MHQWIILGLLWLCPKGYSTTIAVIDSGLDIEHPDIHQHLYINQDEYPDNRRDDDQNGYVDDHNGWNFSGQNGELINRQYQDSFTPDVATFFALQAKSLEGEATESEKEWMKNQLKDPDFIKTITIYGNYAHGTHVAGIALMGHKDLRVMGLKLLPTTRPFSAAARLAREGKKDQKVNWLEDKLLRLALSLLARAQGAPMGMVAEFINQKEAPVANASFGVGLKQALSIVKPLLGRALSQPEAHPELLDRYGRFFMGEVLKAQKVLCTKAPHTLLVTAAGNDGANNDEDPISPAGLTCPNKISVAALDQRGQLASFSNFGGDTVDIAAPGVGIDSSVPDGGRLKMSGTSQAAPYIAHVAALLYLENPALSPEAMKEILMGTVDHQPHLKGKVKSMGSVNLDRARYAAKRSLDLDLASAIAEALATWPDVPYLPQDHHPFSPYTFLPSGF